MFLYGAGLEDADLRLWLGRAFEMLQLDISDEHRLWMSRKLSELGEDAFARLER